MAALAKEYSFATEWYAIIKMKNYADGFGTGLWVEGGRVLRCLLEKARVASKHGRNRGIRNDSAVASDRNVEHY